MARTYPGGKGKCYQRLINLMPPHRVYIESHLGGAAVMRRKRPAAINIGIDVDERVIATQQATLPDCSLITADAVTFLEEYPFKGDELVYADPPYLPETRRKARIYRHEYTAQQHERLLDVLTRLPCMVVLSGYDNALYGRRLRAWRKTSFMAKTQADVREESVWMNFPPPAVLHDGSHLGGTFRERQTMKRRHGRVLDRFDRMDPVERQHVFRMLEERFSWARTQ